MPTDRCEKCNRPRAKEWPAPPGTCAVRATEALLERVFVKSNPEDLFFVAACEAVSAARADCAAHAVDWPARCRALAAALRRYGRHSCNCAAIQQGWSPHPNGYGWQDGDESDCDCGLGAALTGGGR